MRILCVAAAFGAALVSGCGNADKSPTESAPAAYAADEQMADAPADAVARESDRKSAKEASRGLPSNAIHLEPAVIVDATGFEQPMGAATLFIPKGWRAEGGVFWGQEFMCTNGYAFNWRATSPDGLKTIAILPQERWEANNYGAPPSTPGCQLAPYTNVQQFLEGLVQRAKPGARVVDYRARPDLASEFSRLNSQTPTAMGEMRTWVEAGEILVAFNEEGRDMQGTVAAVAVFNLMHTNPVSGMGAMDAITGATFPAYAATAPNGELNFEFVEAIRRSIKVNPQWDQRINNHNAAIGRVALEESRKRAQIINETNAEISRIRQETWNAQQESADRRAREFGELIKGVETYSDANAPGGQVELSHMYDNAWRLNDGSYVLTNDKSFEPYRDLGVDGRKLDPAQ
ncbi:MAG: hypothetical protein WD076_01540 [Parvularculaceae bacterium]